MNGIINLYKPRGLSSNTAVGKVKRLLSVKKCGHTGTLDPLAEGVLPILVNSATSFCELIMSGEKEYVAVLHLGHTTTTLDSEGEDITLLPREEVKVSREQFETALSNFIGEIEQIPPMYSAVSQNGVRLYKLARQGIEIERTPRKITVYSITCEDFDEIEKIATIRVSCSKGTYIRTLAEDIGNSLGVGAMILQLIRTKTGGFDIKDAVTLEELTEKDIIPIENSFLHLPIVKPIDFFFALLINGQKVLQHKLNIDVKVSEYVRLYNNENKFVGLAVADENEEGRLLQLVKRV